jgi:hypothetical protein
LTTWLTNARASDIDYYFTSQLPGEPLEASRISTRTRPFRARCVRLSVGF